MKKKIKLRDLTPEQLINYTTRICTRFTPCDSCLFGKVKCFIRDSGSWVLDKDMYSDKFLDQEIEIEVGPIFTDKERKYLHNVLKPFRDRIVEIRLNGDRYIIPCYFQIVVKSSITSNGLDSITLPFFNSRTMYKGLEVGKAYKDDELKELLKELDL